MSGDIHYFPRWMKDLKRNSSFVLEESDWNLLQKVQSMASKKFNRKTSNANNGKMSRELNDLVSSLENLVKYQKMYSESGRYFKQNYPKWRLVRDTNVETLKEIANTIQENKENCDGVRLAGSLASLVGGGASLAAEDEDSFAANFGRGITLLGSIFAAGSTIVEEILLREKIKEAKVIVEKDRMLFDLMWSCESASSQQVASSIDEIFEEINMNRLQWRNIRKVIQSFLHETSKRRHETEIEMSIRKMLNSLDVPPELRREICDVVAATMAILMVWKHHGALFELVSVAYKIKNQFEAFSGGLLTALNVWSKYENYNSASPRKSVVVVGMLMDVVSIAKTSSEISQKTQRKESDLLRKIAKLLQDEADKLRSMYYQFFTHNAYMYA